LITAIIFFAYSKEKLMKKFLKVLSIFSMIFIFMFISINGQNKVVYKKKTKFRNPIRQNWGHIYALKKVLSDFKQVTYHPIIVFTGSAELKNISSQIPVIYDRQLIRTIKDKTRIPNISIEQVKSLAGKLDEVNIIDKTARKEHNRQVRNQVYQRKRKEKSKVCPSPTFRVIQKRVYNILINNDIRSSFHSPKLRYSHSSQRARIAFPGFHPSWLSSVSSVPFCFPVLSV